MPYTPSEMAIDTLKGGSPYGDSGVSEEEAERTRRQTEYTASPAEPRVTSGNEETGGSQFGPQNPGSMQWPEEPQTASEAQQPRGSMFQTIDRNIGTQDDGDDPFSGLRFLGEAGSALGQAGGAAMGAISGLVQKMDQSGDPLLKAAAFGAQAGGIPQALLGLPALASGSPKVREAFSENYKTMGGQDPNLLDAPAVFRALVAAEMKRGEELAASAADTSLDPEFRRNAAIGAAAYNLLPFLLPIPGIKGTATAAKGSGAASLAERGAMQQLAEEIAQGGGKIGVEELAAILPDTPTTTGLANAAARTEDVAGFLMTAEQKIARDFDARAAQETALVERQGLGGTGGQAPLPPGGPTFGTGQFPEGTQPLLNRIQQAPEMQAVRPHLGFAEQAKIKERYKDLPFNDLASDLRKYGAGETGGRIDALNDRVAGLVQQADGYFDKIQDGTATAADRLNARVAIQEALFGRSAVVGAQSEAARVTGAIGRKPVRADLSARQRSVFDAINRIGETDPKMIDTVTEAIVNNANNPKKLASLLTTIGERPDVWTRAGDAFWEYYRANTLWNVATHITNFTSGPFQQGLYVARSSADQPVATVKHLPQLGKGYAQAAVNVLPKSAQDFLSARIGIFEDLADQLAMVSEQTKFQESNRYYPEGGAIPGPLGKVARTPFTALRLADVFQTKPLYNFALKLHAEKAGKAKGLKGQALQDFVDNIPNDVFEDIHAKAWDDAETYSLHRPGPLAEVFHKIRRVPYISPLMKANILFVDTPTALAELGLRYSPIGALRIPRNLFSAEGRAQIPNIAKEAVIGSGVTGGFLALMETGNMTGLTPRSPTERQLMEAEGVKPMSIRASAYPVIGPILRVIYGDKADSTWVPANLMGPLVYPAVIAAAVKEFTTDGHEMTAETALQSAAAAGYTMLNTVPIFSTYQAINDVLKEPSADNVVRWAANLTKPLIPAESLGAQVQQLRDGFKKNPADFWEILKMTIPGLGDQVRLDYDVIGRKIPHQTGPGGVFIGNRAVTERPHPVLAEDRRLRQANQNFNGLNLPSGSFSEGANLVRLTPDEYSDYQRQVGEAKEKTISALMKTPQYKEADDIGKSQMFEAKESEADSKVKREFVTKLLKSVKSADEVVRAAAIASTLPRGDYALTLEEFQKKGILTPEVRAQIDEKRGADSQTGERYPTVDDMLTIAPLIKQYRAIKPYTDGTPEQWARRSELEGLRRAALKNQPDPDRASIAFQRSLTPEDRRILSFQFNPQRTLFIQRTQRQHPTFAEYVTRTE